MFAVRQGRDRTRDPRIETVFQSHLINLQMLTDRVFACLLVAQWLFAIACSIWVSPRTWVGAESSVHIHVWSAVFLGGVLISLPLGLIIWFPRSPLNRFVNATAQVLFSSLLIHLMGGRIEAHFHIFGSLAILSFYRDARVLMLAVGIVLLDHVVRGVFWPETVFGIVAAAPWRAVEHAGWVMFEATFLLWGVAQSRTHLRSLATLQVSLMEEKQQLEEQVQQRLKEYALIQIQLAQAQKLEAIGSLAAGISHEINTPMQCVSSNVEFLKSCSQRVREIMDRYHEMLHSDAPASRSTRIAAISKLTEALRFDHMRQQVPEAIDEAAIAVDRVVEILRAMKAMSHPGTKGKVPTDINAMIRNAVQISRSRWKHVASFDLELAQTLPQVNAFPAEFGQVMLNLIVNAADAIGEKEKDAGGRLGVIRVCTTVVDAGVMIEVSDNGCGIPESNQERLFDPFFTTKGVGLGTGQGLAITRDFVVNQHNGTLDFKSQVGVGTTFTLWLPFTSTEKHNEQAEQGSPNPNFETTERFYSDAQAIVC